MADSEPSTSATADPTPQPGPSSQQDTDQSQKARQAPAPLSPSPQSNLLPPTTKNVVASYICSRVQFPNEPNANLEIPNHANFKATRICDEIQKMASKIENDADARLSYEKIYDRVKKNRDDCRSTAAGILFQLQGGGVANAYRRYKRDMIYWFFTKDRKFNWNKVILVILVSADIAENAVRSVDPENADYEMALTLIQFCVRFITEHCENKYIKPNAAHAHLGGWNDIAIGHKYFAASDHAQTPRHAVEVRVEYPWLHEGYNVNLLHINAPK